MESPSVADLVVQLHSNIDSIHACVQSLSDTKVHDAVMEKLEAERDSQIAALHKSHQTETQKLAEQREKEEEDLAEQRRKEEEELMERRRREDQERRARFEREEQERLEKKKAEDEAKERALEEKRRSVSDNVEKELERLEDEMERKVEEGKNALAELDEKRRAINAQIEAALNTPNVIPKINFRSRARTRGMSTVGGKVTNNEAAQSIEPKELASDEGSGPPVSSENPDFATERVNDSSDLSALDRGTAAAERPVSEEGITYEVSEASNKDGGDAEHNVADSEAKSREEHGLSVEGAQNPPLPKLPENEAVEKLQTTDEEPIGINIADDDNQSSSAPGPMDIPSSNDFENNSSTVLESKYPAMDTPPAPVDSQTMTEVPIIIEEKNLGPAIIKNISSDATADDTTPEAGKAKDHFFGNTDEQPNAPSERELETDREGSQTTEQSEKIAATTERAPLQVPDKAISDGSTLNEESTTENTDLTSVSAPFGRQGNHGSIHADDHDDTMPTNHPLWTPEETEACQQA